jgi:hypothetical protein
VNGEMLAYNYQKGGSSNWYAKIQTMHREIIAQSIPRILAALKLFFFTTKTTKSTKGRDTFPFVLFVVFVVKKNA